VFQVVERGVGGRSVGARGKKHGRPDRCGPKKGKKKEKNGESIAAEKSLDIGKFPEREANLSTPKKSNMRNWRAFGFAENPSPLQKSRTCIDKEGKKGGSHAPKRQLCRHERRV